MTLFTQPSRRRTIATLLLVSVFFALLVGGSAVVAPKVARAVSAADVVGIAALGNPITASLVALAFVKNFFFGGEESCNSTDVACILKSLIVDSLNAIHLVVGKLFLWVFQFLLWLAGSNDAIIETPAVTVGWVIVRDVANMFFIFVLLLIAFSTIIGSEKLNYKQHLMRLILVALVINFSKMITGIFIDFSQVVMLTFANALGTPGGFITTVGLLDAGSLRPDATISPWHLIANTVFGILLLVFATITVGALAAMLMARMLMLWILTILSPIAFLAATFPQGAQYYTRWWSELSKNLISGPVLVFFLWLALSVQDQMQAIFSGFGDKLNVTVGESQIGASASLATFFVTMGLLIAGIKIAVEAGGAGAGAVGAVGAIPGKMGQKLKSLGQYAAKGAGTWAATGFTKKTGIEIRPQVIAHKFNEAMKRIGVRREQEAQDSIQKRWTKGGPGSILAAPGLESAQTEIFQGFLGLKGIKEFWKRSKLAKGTTEIDGEKFEGRDGLLAGDKRLGVEIPMEEASIKEQEDAVNAAENPEHFAEGLAAGLKGTFTDPGIEGKLRDEQQKVRNTLNYQDIGDLLEKNEEIEGRGLSEEEEGEEKKKILQEYFSKLDGQKLQSIGLDKKSVRAMMSGLMSGEGTAEEKAGQLYTMIRNTSFDRIKGSFNDDEKNKITQQGRMTVDGKIQLEEANQQDLERKKAAATTDEEKKNFDAQIAASGKKLDILKARNTSPATLATMKTKLEHARQNLLVKQKKKKEIGKKIRQSSGAMDFDVVAGRRAQIEEEKKKIVTTNEDELIDMYHAAKEGGDTVRMMAIVSKATEVGHLNEMVNEEGFPSNAGGLKGLVEKMIPDMDPQLRLNFMNDLSNKAEATGHWIFGQAVGSKNGQLYARDEEEQISRVYTEMGKRNWSNAFNQNNRLAMGTEEWKDPNDHSKGRQWTPGPHFLLALEENIDAVAHRVARGEFNANIMLNIGQNIKRPEVAKMFEDLAKRLDHRIAGPQGKNAGVLFRGFLGQCSKVTTEGESPKDRIRLRMEQIKQAVG